MMDKTKGSFMVQLDGKEKLYWATPVTSATAPTIAEREGIDAMAWTPAEQMVGNETEDTRRWLFVAIGVNLMLVPMSRVTAIKVGTTPTSGGVKT